jgi:CelD/BcsL family acetyltransferase involved in cellulose biosynthesis
MQDEVAASAPPTVVTVDHSIGGVAGEWEGLVRETGMHPFMRPGWLTAWHDAFGTGPIEVLTARQAGRLVGILPLERHRGALSSLANWHTPEFEPVCLDEGVGRELVAAAAQEVTRRLDLAFLPRSGSARNWVDDRLEAGARILVRGIERSPYVLLDGDWEAYESALPVKRRSDLRRRRRRLTELGELTIGPENGDLTHLLEQGFEVEASGWKGEGQTAIAEDPQARRFYELVARWAAEEGLLALWFLRIDGRPIAFAFCITTGEAHYVLKIGFDAAHARFAPGLVLTQEMLRAAFDAGLGSYEFLGAEEDYKLIWTDRGHERERLQVFPRTARGAFEHAAWAHGRPLVKRMLRR